MRTAHFSPYGGFPDRPPQTETPLERDLPPHRRHMGPGSQTGSDIIQRTHPSPVNRMTDMCKNITLPQTLFADGKNASSPNSTQPKNSLHLKSSESTCLFCSPMSCLREPSSRPRPLFRGYFSCHYFPVSSPTTVIVSSVFISNLFMLNI